MTFDKNCLNSSTRSWLNKKSSSLFINRSPEPHKNSNPRLSFLFLSPETSTKNSFVSSRLVPFLFRSNPSRLLVWFVVRFLKINLHSKFVHDRFLKIDFSECQPRFMNVRSRHHDDRHRHHVDYPNNSPQPFSKFQKRVWRLSSDYFIFMVDWLSYCY